MLYQSILSAISVIIVGFIAKKVLKQLILEDNTPFLLVNIAMSVFLIIILLESIILILGGAK